MHSSSRFVVALGIASAALLAQQEPGEKPALQRAALIEGSVSLGRQDARVEVPVAFEKLSVRPSNEPAPFERLIPGLLLVHVRAGELEVSIDGERSVRRTGEFLVVPPQSSLTVRSEEDTVILAAYSIGQDYLDRLSNRPVVQRYVRPDGFYEETAPNLRSREAYRIGDPEYPIAVIRDFNVGPGLRTEPYRFQGAAMIQVSSGEALTVIGDRESKSQLGDSFSVSDRETFSVDNSQSKRPFKIRAFILPSEAAE